MDEAATAALAARLAAVLRAGDWITLEGTYGVGKTSFARALIRSRLAEEIEVTSPSFTLVHDYPCGDIVIRHSDLYRLQGEDEWLELGLLEDAGTVTIVEWPEIAQASLPVSRLALTMTGPFAGRPACERHVVFDVPPEWTRRLAVMGILPTLPSAALDLLAASGLREASMEPLRGDASSRRYWRLAGPRGQAVLMDVAGDHAQLQRWLDVRAWLETSGLRIPALLGVDRKTGLAVIEDLGEASMASVITAAAPPAKPSLEKALYDQAIDLLLRAQERLPPASLPPMDAPHLLGLLELFLEWCAPSCAASEKARFRAIWETLLVEAGHGQPRFLHRDFHSENLIPTADGKLAVIDFQDACRGSPLYDLVSLLDDARCNVSTEVRTRATQRFLAGSRHVDEDTLARVLPILRAQRAMRILAVFARLKAQGKVRYQEFVPRVETYLREALTHPSLANLQAWCDAHDIVPAGEP